MEKPRQLQDTDLGELYEICQEHLDYIGSAKYHEDNDNAHYIYEVAMETVFGKDVWDYINSKN